MEIAPPHAPFLLTRALALAGCLLAVSCAGSSGTVAVLKPVSSQQIEIDLTTNTLTHLGPLGILPWHDRSHDYLYIPRGEKSTRHGTRQIDASEIRFYRGETSARPGLTGSITIDHPAHTLEISLRQKPGRALLPSNRNGRYPLKSQWGAA